MEKLIKFNGIPLSPKTGIRNIIFDTSRYSAGMESIRGFGTVMSESNLANIETVNLHFVLKTEELANLAYIYSLFRTLGVLVVENDYLLDKLSSSLANSLAEDRMVFHDKVLDKIKGTNKDKEDSFSRLRKNFNSLCMVLDNLSIKSKVNTSDGYDVNMNLSLYKNSFTKEEQNKYMKIFDLWLKKTGFNKIKDEIAEQTNRLNNTSIGLDLKYYNIEALNAVYKNNLITSEYKSYKLQQNADLNKKVRTDTEADNLKKRTTENKIGLEDSDFNNETLLLNKLESVTKTIKIPNNCIMEIELITNNNIANIPIRGNSIMDKSIIGLGKTNFSCKLLFKEEEELNLVQQLKTITDKNIIGHKLKVEHPLIQLFDFYSGDILNMSFNSLENQHGIIATMVFNINGYRYEQESLINNSDNIGDIVFKKKSKNDKLFGSWLEIYNNYLNLTKEKLSLENVLKQTSFLFKPISEILNSYYNSYSWTRFFNKKEVTNLSLIDFIFSYGTQFTNAFHYVMNLKGIIFHKDTMKIIQQQLTYLNTDSIDQNLFQFQDIMSNILGFNDIKKQLVLSDFNTMYNIMNYFDCAVVLKDEAGKKNGTLKNDRVITHLLKKIVRPISMEMFNDKLNNNSESNKIYRKIYEEFFIRLDSLIDNSLNFKIDILSQKGTFKYYDCFEMIQKCASEIIESFLTVLSDNKFIKRIVDEILYDIENPTPLLKDDYKQQITDIKNELSFYFKSNKQNIYYSLYNMFLLRLTEFNLTENNCKEINKNNNYYDNITKNNMLNLLLKGTILSCPLLLKTDNRTDNFYLCAETIFGFLGSNISKYNFKLDSEKLFWISELKQKYGNDIKVYDTQCVYINNTKYEDLGEQEGQIIGDLAKKDIDWLYGNKIQRLSLFSLIGKVFYENEAQNADFSIQGFIENERMAFLSSVKYCDIKMDEDKKQATDYFVPNINIGNIHLPSDNKYKFTVSTDLNKRKEEKAGIKNALESLKNISNFWLKDKNTPRKINTLMKTRVIANDDPFNNILNINKTLVDNIDTVFPDYVIVINVKEATEDSLNEYYVQLKNVTSISISKNPKTKIKTANFTISMPTKSYYNYNMNDGAFSIKAMQDGKIKGFIIKPGCEVRIMLGYSFNNSYSIFNGLVVGSQEIGNSLMVSCASFASTLYNFIPNELEVTNEKTLGGVEKEDLEDNSNERGNNGPVSFKSNNVVPTDNEFLTALRNKKAGLNNPNMYLFEAFGPNMYDTFAQQGTSSFSMVTQLLLIRMGYRYRPYFENKFKEGNLNRDLNFLANNFQNKIDLTETFGSRKQETEIVGNILTNIFDVDLDYEAYGYIKDKNFKPDFETGTYDNSKEPAKIVDNNTKPGQKREYMIKPCNPCVISETFWNNSGMGAWFGTKRNTSRGWHAGADYSYRQMEPSKQVYAVADGIAKCTNAMGSNGAGKYIYITHDDGIISTGYFHLEKFLILDGKHVKKGEPIGIAGGTGKKAVGDSYAKHLHFEVRVKKNEQTTKFYEEQVKLNGERYIRVKEDNKDKRYFFVNPELFLTGEFSIIKSDNKAFDSKGRDKRFNIDKSEIEKDYREYFKEKIKLLEGFRSTFYQDNTKAAKGWSKGYGFHSGGLAKSRDVFTEEEYKKYFNREHEEPMSQSEANRFLDLGVTAVENQIRKQVRGSNYDKLKPNHKIALLDIAWKYSTYDEKIFKPIFGKLIDGDIQGAIDILNDKYDKSEAFKERKSYIERLIRGV